MRVIHPTYKHAFQELTNQFRWGASAVHPDHWQGVDVSTKPEMLTYELLHPSFSVAITSYDGDMEAVQKDVGANLPWADEHFKERVCGEPINPGIQWAKWPYGHSAEKFLDEHGQFNHNYMERYWPKYAGHFAVPTKDAADFNSVAEDVWGSSRPHHSGIKYKYGDLQDVVDLLRDDPYTRQAYLPVWFPEDTGGGNKRAPCTLGYHFIMRRNYLDVTYYIRSCDFMRHFRDDVYLTHALVAWVWNQLRCSGGPEAWKDVELGRFNMHITSLHIFANDWRTLFPHDNPPKR